MKDSLRLPAILLLVILGLLALGWVWGVATNWPEIVSRPVRLAYIICDVAFVIPVGVAAALGVLRRKTWALPVFTLALGALLFDVAHGVFYLIWDNYFNIPLPVAFALLAVTAGYVAWATRLVIARITGAEGAPAPAAAAWAAAGR